MERTAGQVADWSQFTVRRRSDKKVRLATKEAQTNLTGPVYSRSKKSAGEAEDTDYESSPLVKHAKHMQRIRRSATVRDRSQGSQGRDRANESFSRDSKGSSPIALKRQRSNLRVKPTKKTTSGSQAQPKQSVDVTASRASKDAFAITKGPAAEGKLRSSMAISFQDQKEASSLRSTVQMDNETRDSELARRRTVFQKDTNSSAGAGAAEQTQQLLQSAQKPLQSILKSKRGSAVSSTATDHLPAEGGVHVGRDHVGNGNSALAALAGVTSRKRNSSVETLSMNSIRIICAKCGAVKPMGTEHDCPESRHQSRSRTRTANLNDDIPLDDQ